MIDHRDGGDGMKTTKANMMKKADRMEIKRVKMEMGSFLYKIEP